MIILSLHEYEGILQNLIKEEVEKKLKNGEKIDDEKLQSVIQELYSPEKIHEYADPIYQSLLEQGPTMVEEERLMNQEFESRLQLTWLPAFYSISSVIKIAEETAGELIDYYMEKHAKKEGNQYYVSLTFDVLLKLYSRSIVLSKEIKKLLESGFADGAMSRWRSLHECNVYFRILTMNYNDENFTKDIVHKYFEYSTIEKYQELNHYRNNDCEFDLEDPHYKKIKDEYDEILEKHGKNFRRPYSWAKSVFPKKKRIYFSDLEKKSGIDHLANYYKQANYQIHSSPTGLYNSLGNIQDERVKEYGFILGPSNYGLSIPGQLTIISLAQISTSLLLLESNMDKMIRVSIFQRYVEDATIKFDEIQKEIEEQELESDIKT